MHSLFVYSNEIQFNFSDINVLPNPFSERLQVQFKILGTLHVKISMVTLQGQTVLQEDGGELLPGTYEHDINVPLGLSAGTYILVVNADGGTGAPTTKSVKVVKAK